MWKKIRNLFVSDDHRTSLLEFNENFSYSEDAKLRQLWVSLVRLGISRGLSLPDAEDLTQETIVAGMKAFDPVRGEFGALCRTIMANKAKNLHRAIKPQEPIPEDGGTLADPGDGPGWESYYKQCRERTDRILADAVASLDKQEADFFLVLAEVHGELHHGEVSEAARRAEISTQKGWDIFRKIQRRFKDLDRAILLPERPPVREDGPDVRYALPKSSQHDMIFQRFGSPMPPPSDISAEGEFLEHFRGRYRRFSVNLEGSARRELQSLLK